MARCLLLPYYCIVFGQELCLRNSFGRHAIICEQEQHKKETSWEKVLDNVKYAFKYLIKIIVDDLLL